LSSAEVDAEVDAEVELELEAEVNVKVEAEAEAERSRKSRLEMFFRPKFEAFSISFGLVEYLLKPENSCYQF